MSAKTSQSSATFFFERNPNENEEERKTVENALWVFET